MTAVAFARRVFLLAGSIGVLQIVPLYFMEGYANRLDPPAMNHPEWYYGFAGVTLAWQLAFILIGTDPMRYRPLMPIAVIEKLGYIIAIAVLYLNGRVSLNGTAGATLDILWAVLFTVAFRRTGKPDEPAKLLD